MSQPSPQAADPLVGQMLGGHYVVDGLIAKGGMGHIYRARHARLGREYAVKVLRQEFCTDGKVVKRFTREALAVSQLRHPHTVQVFDTGETRDGIHYIVMEFLEGESLDRRLHRDGRLDVELSVRLIGQAAAALAEAHKKGIVHRDLKPANLFICQPAGVPEFLKILDFGIAKFYTGRRDGKELTKLTAAGSTMGTPHYMAPEQIRGEDVDGRADVYSLGIILWECLVGTPPYNGDSPMEVFLGHLEQDLPLVSSRMPQPGMIPPQLDAVIARDAARDPAMRFPTMEAFKAALDTLHNQLDPSGVFQALRISQGMQIPPSLRSGQMRVDPLAAAAERGVPTAPDGPAAARLGASSPHVIIIAVALAAIAIVVAIGLWLFWPDGDDPTGGGSATDATASVKIYSEPPGARVLVDGDEIGVTPLRLDAPAGESLAVTLESSDGPVDPFELELTPDVDEILGAVVVLEVGEDGGGAAGVTSLWLESDPAGARIVQDGQFTGLVTPIALDVPALGTDAVEIVLEHEGFVAERYRLYPRAGASVALTTILIPESDDTSASQ